MKTEHNTLRREVEGDPARLKVKVREASQIVNGAKVESRGGIGKKNARRSLSESYEISADNMHTTTRNTLFFCSASPFSHSAAAIANVDAFEIGCCCGYCGAML
jgi:hypothetical protein